MGAILQHYTYNRGSFEELEQHHQSYQEAECNANGNDTYSGHLGILPEGLNLDNKKVFDNAEDALQYIEDNHYKWNSAMAVPYKGKAYSYDKAGKKVIAACTKAEKEFTDTQSAVMQEIKSTKSKTITCKNCLSSITRKYIGTPQCPVCYKNNAFYSATQAKRLAAKLQKLNELERKKSSLQRKYAPGIAYVVGGWCPS